jgi:hypothetical protein
MLLKRPALGRIHVVVQVGHDRGFAIAPVPANDVSHGVMFS